MLYTWKVRFLKTRRGNLMWRYWRAWRGDKVGDYSRLSEYIRTYAPGCSFIDVGCMWGVNGEHAFIAEEAGAVAVKAVDVFGPTPEFEEKKRARNSKVEFILGDATHSETIGRIGEVDVVFCAGLLYHHPSPFDLLVALRRICRKTLILRTSTIPEIKGLRNSAVYFPMLKLKERRLWNLATLGLARQAGITDGFDPSEGYGNWFWGLTPSCLESLLETAGFRVEDRAIEAFVQTLVCCPVEKAFTHRLPDEEHARQVGREVSSAGIALPA